METWKVIPEFQNYLISDFGNIVNIKNGRRRSLKIILNKNGYCHVTLSINGIKKIMRIHRLVLTTFNPNSDKSLQVNHIDGIKHNNKLSNLEWVTLSQNMKHSFDVLGRIGNQKGKYGSNHNTAKKVIQKTKYGEFIKLWDCKLEAAKVLGIDTTNISHCIRGRQKTAGGYKWELV